VRTRSSNERGRSREAIWAHRSNERSQEGFVGQPKLPSLNGLIGRRNVPRSEYRLASWSSTTSQRRHRLPIERASRSEL
jgi:hypothetical protein